MQRQRFPHLLESLPPSDLVSTISPRPQDKAGAELLHDFCWATHQSREKGLTGKLTGHPISQEIWALRTVTTRRAITSRGGAVCLHQAQLWVILHVFLVG